MTTCYGHCIKQRQREVVDLVFDLARGEISRRKLRLVELLPLQQAAILYNFERILIRIEKAIKYAIKSFELFSQPL